MKTAFVTGGSRGIGRAICRELSDAGYRVAFLYRENGRAAEETLATLNKGRAFRGDVRDRERLTDIFDELRASWGPIQVLVNNAGINKPTDFDAVTDADWDEILSVNLKGPFVCSQVALPFIEDGGAIVMIGSVSGQYGGPRTAHYAASKAGLISLAQVIARFGAPRGIRCNTIAAGLISSEMAAAGLQDEAVRKAAAGIPLGRLGTPHEVARAVRFLASAEASYITAQTINVNGGLYF